MNLKEENKSQILAAAYEIKRLATLETCSLVNELDEACLLPDFRAWVQWFDIEANKIIKALSSEASVK